MLQKERKNHIRLLIAMALLKNTSKNTYFYSQDDLLVPPTLADMLLSFQFGFEFQDVQSAINQSETKMRFTDVACR